MKQTISVNLNRQVFYLDLDAYDTLKKYLDEIKKYFSKEASSTEVVDDIEARIAEKFGDIIGRSKKAIQLADVDKIIEEMGSVDDITGVEEDVKTEEVKSEEKRKLFRDPDTKIVAGIISGIAAYFDAKSLFFRIAFIVLLVNPATFWIAIVGYIAAWIFIPEAKTSLEKLEMRGKPATVSELQTAIETKASDTVSTVETKTRNILQRWVLIFVNLFRFCLVWTIRLGGFFAFFTLICMIVALVVGLVFVYFEPSIPYFDLSFMREISSPFLEILIVALGVIFLAPLTFFLDISESIMSWKWHFSFRKTIILILIWISAVIVFAGISKINYPKYGPKLINSINKVKYLTWIDDTNFKTLVVKDITDVDISAVREVTITEGQVNEVKIIGHQYAIDELTTNFTNGKLSISGHTAKWFNNMDHNGYVTPVRIEITTKKLNNLKLDDNIDALYYPFNSNVNLDLGNWVGLKVIGKLNNVKASVGIRSVLNLLDTEVNQIDLTLKQATVKVWAKKINVLGDSHSTLIYKGTPQIVKGVGDSSSQSKYSLSKDYNRIDDAVKNTLVTINGTKSKIGDLVWSTIVAKQNDDNFYNIFTAVKLKPADTSVYLLWLTEKDGLITLKNSLKINNWESVTSLDVLNDKTLEVTGQIYGSELKSETIEIYINKIKGVLELKPKATATPEIN